MDRWISPVSRVLWFPCLVKRSGAMLGSNPARDNQVRTRIPRIWWDRDRTSSLAAKPLGNESVVLLPAFGGVVPAKVLISATDPDDGQILRLRVAVLRNSSTSGGHWRLPWLPKSSTGTTFLRTSKPHCPTQTGILTPGFGVTYVKWAILGSNQRPLACRASALTN